MQDNKITELNQLTVGQDLLFHYHGGKVGPVTIFRVLDDRVVIDDGRDVIEVKESNLSSLQVFDFDKPCEASINYKKKRLDYLNSIWSDDEVDLVALRANIDYVTRRPEIDPSLPIDPMENYK